MGNESHNRPSNMLCRLCCSRESYTQKETRNGSDYTPSARASVKRASAKLERKVLLWLSEMSDEDSSNKEIERAVEELEDRVEELEREIEKRTFNIT